MAPSKIAAENAHAIPTIHGQTVFLRSSPMPAFYPVRNGGGKAIWDSDL